VREREIEWTDLMQSGNAGDSAAYQRLLLEITPVLRITAERELVRAGLPIDCREAIVQEILLAVHLKRHTWDANAQFCSWLFAIARNKLLGAKHRNGQHVLVDIDDFAAPSLDGSPTGSLKVAEVDEHIQGLPQRQRYVCKQSSLSAHR
jgi:RNA polymerase sigma-70 factor (ECF subfamily)